METGAGGFSVNRGSSALSIEASSATAECWTPLRLTLSQEEIFRLPSENLVYLLPSRYCEVDSELSDFAWANFAAAPAGWARVQRICDFVHGHIQFDYMKARSNRTALEAFRERVGVCRDFTHLAIALCRCMNVPARYVTGYLGDIGIPPAPYPMDFSAWMEVYLGGRWYAFDPRHNRRRIGRIVIARGRDASDVALTTVFGKQQLAEFLVITEEVPQNRVLLAPANSKGNGSSSGNQRQNSDRHQCGEVRIMIPWLFRPLSFSPSRAVCAFSARLAPGPQVFRSLPGCDQVRPLRDLRDRAAHCARTCRLE